MPSSFGAPQATAGMHFDSRWQALHFPPPLPVPTCSIPDVIALDIPLPVLRKTICVQGSRPRTETAACGFK